MLISGMITLQSKLHSIPLVFFWFATSGKIDVNVCSRKLKRIIIDTNDGNYFVEVNYIKIHYPTTFHN